MKKYLLSLSFLFTSFLYAQKIDSIFVNLYTDSLKKGTYNYINIDGLLSNGSYMPLDSSHIIFSASDGNFTGNCLWVEPAFQKEKILIKVRLRSNPAIHKEFEIFIKKKPDDEYLKTVEEIKGSVNKKKKNT